LATASIIGGTMFELTGLSKNSWRGDPEFNEALSP